MSEGHQDYLSQLRELTSLQAIILQHETETTFEAINVGISIGGVDNNLFANANIIGFLGFKHDQAQQFIWHAIKGSDITVGPYIASYYWDLFNQAREMGTQLITGEQGQESRQLVLSFPKAHCFQSIQILIRHDAINVITTMRSCNYEVNFMTDIFISYMVGEVIRSCTGCTNYQINVMMSIGSLHIYK